ncbi:hypothetical protein KR222_000103, partial [Zaprionus bogoriensis]
TPEQKAKHLEDVQACTQQVGITREQATAMRDGQFDNVDAKAKCFAKCVLEKMNFLVDGKLVPAKVQELLVPIDGSEITNNVLSNCSSFKGSDACDTAYLIYECIHKNRR